MALWSNPEFLRNVRAQLRPGKVLATACICAALSIATGFAVSSQSRVAVGPYGWGSVLFQVAFWLQALMVAVGGGIACINNIYREKEQNTFDYQRVTRLTPLELTLGKLFGAPVFTYFVFLCLMPLAIFGAVKGEMRISTLLAAYVVLLIGSLTVHTLALLISLLTVRGSHTGAILLLLVLVWGSSFSADTMQFFKVGPFGPFYSIQVLQHESWFGSPARFQVDGPYRIPADTDVFFGHEVRHFPMFLAVDLLFAGWFLLALVRNIKRDQNDYEIYSPVQSLVFALFLNLLFVAFMQWRRAGEGTSASWLATVWPAPMIIAGTLAAGLLIVLGIAHGRNSQLEWSANLAILRSLFFVAWFARDMQFLQWMSLRRGKHPLVMGVLFLVIFYVCVMILTAPKIFAIPERTAFSAFFLPSPVFLLDHSAWILRPAIWIAAFVAQWVLVALFIGLQKQTIDELNSSATVPATEAVPVHP